ncbi:MAG: hypothetical protein ABH816_01435 [Candidatus Levyibacteriota bacterium]
MPNFQKLISIFLFFLLFFAFDVKKANAEETGFRFPTTCATNGSSCENMRDQGINYNSWINATYEYVDTTFTDFNVPENGTIDDIQIKMRIRTNTSGWQWNMYFTDNNGVKFYAASDWCRVSPFSCKYNTDIYFNSINSVTFTFLNTNSNKEVTGAMLNSPGFFIRLWQSAGIKNTDIDTLLFNVRYHIAEPTPTPTPIPGVTSYLITKGFMVADGEEIWGRAVFYRNIPVPFRAGGRAIISRNPDGTGLADIGDSIFISIMGPYDKYFTFDAYGSWQCSTPLIQMPPQDITDILVPYIEVNIVSIRFSNYCGRGKTIGPLYLIYYAPTPTPTPSPSPSPTPTPTPSKTPLIFIPGIGGSELKTTEAVNWSKPDGHGGTFTHNYSSGENVWVNNIEAIKPGNDDYFDVLRMQPDGQTSEANLVLTGNVYDGAYGSAINFFTSNGYTLNQDLFVFPYDWRKDVSETAPLLDQKIEQIKQQTGSAKVDIVAHSLGGLVARNYITDSARAQKVRKLITLGTPNLGSPRFLKALRSGDCLFLEVGPFCLSIAESEIQDVVQNSISGYELAPSQKYYEFYNGSDNNHPLPFIDNRDIDNNGVVGFLNYQQIKTMLANLNYNTALFNPAEAFHQLDDNLGNTNGVDVTNVAGSGNSTLGQIIEDYAVNFAGIKIPKTDMRNINGDDTVPLYSASLVDGAKSLAGSSKIYYTNQNHSNLVFNGPALNLAKNILNNDDNIPAGISNGPFSFSGNTLSVHSPILINAYDASGNHTGPLPNGDFEANIPGSSYETLGDAKFIWLPDDGQYTIKFEATGQGSFDFKIRNYNNDVNDKTILYKNVLLMQNTKAETTFDTTSSEPPILAVDSDGNGTIDREVNSTTVLEGNANYDQIPPKTTVNLTGTKGQNDWFSSNVKVELIATDEANGSGVQKTEYSLDNGQTIQTYTTSFTISTEGVNKLKFKSTDNAGNEEIPQELEIKIDKTAPVITLSANPNQLWPVNKKMVDVTINGSIKDSLSGIASKTFTVTDEYQTPMPLISDFGQTIKLEARRDGDDKDGRIYEIRATSTDFAGNQALATTQVIVPHDQGKK